LRRAINESIDMPMIPPRLVPERPFPPYSYVSGSFPHPLRDPQGHRYGHPAADASQPFEPTRWAECRDYLAAIDLFNHGYYWEAHEAWEGLWHRCGRTGATADFLKGLIKLAAAGVKAREGRFEGVRRHAQRAGELFAFTAERVATERFLGLQLAELQSHCKRLIDDPAIASPPVPRSAAEVPPVEVLFDFFLVPEESQQDP
jgi:hypothetical protein